MKMRAAKGEGALALEEFDGFTTGLVALAGRPVLDAHHYGVGGLLDRLVGLFGRANVYVELQRHLLRDEESDLVALDRRWRARFACRWWPPTVSASPRPTIAPLFDVLTCVRHKTTLDAAGRRLARNAERYLKSPEVDGAAVRRSPRRARRHGGAGRAARVHDGGSRLPVSRVSGAGRRDGDVVPAPHHRRRRARSLPARITTARARRSPASSI